MANDAANFYQIRGLRAEETPLLETFLYEAIFIPEGVTPPPRSIVRDPSLSCYIDAFGSGDVPTLAIAVLPAHRGQGIGAALLHAMLRTLARHGWQRVALSVQKANPALRLYQRAGFTIVQDNDEELVMVREIMQ